MSLDASQIESADDKRVEKVSVPEWGGHVYIRMMDGSERDDWEASMTRFVGNKAIPVLDNAHAKLLVRTLADKDGNRLFSDSQLAVVARKSGAVLNRLYEIARDLNGLGEVDPKDRGDQGGGSGSG